MVVLIQYDNGFSVMAVHEIYPEVGLVFSLPCNPLTGNSIYRGVLGKETGYLIVIAFGEDNRLYMLLDLLCCNCRWEVRDPAVRSVPHSRHCTCCIWRFLYYRPFSVIRHVYVASECLPGMWQVWQTILTIFFTFFQPHPLNKPYQDTRLPLWPL